MEPIEIRRCTADDLAAWVRLRAVLHELDDADLAAEAADAAAWLRRSDATVLVAAHPDGRLAGFAEIGTRPYADGCDTSPVAYLEAWYVEPAARRAGVGAALVQAGERWARDRGHRELASDALLDNAVSHAAHRALGFEEVERSVKYRKALAPADRRGDAAVDVELRRPTCTLRPLVLADAPSLARHADDREVWLNLRDRFPHPYTLDDAHAYIAAVAAQAPRTSFGIVVAGEAAGTISLMPGDDIARRTCEIGYWIGRPWWGRGVATDAVRAVTAYAFATLGMHRVFALPFTRNAASRRVLEKAGYVLEGTLRHSAVKDGEVLDQWLLAACADGAGGD